MTDKTMVEYETWRHRPYWAAHRRVRQYEAFHKGLEYLVCGAVLLFVALCVFGGKG